MHREKNDQGHFDTIFTEVFSSPPQKLLNPYEYCELLCDDNNIENFGKSK